MFGGEASDKKVKVLSGGERTRLAMIKLLLEPVNLLILDEPTNHLDMPSKDILKDAIRDFDGTAIIVSHDRDFLDGLVTKVYEFGGGKVREHLCGIYEYLQERNIDSLAELQRNNKDKTTDTPNDEEIHISESKLSYEAQKEFNRNKKKLEKQIKDYEKEIDKLVANVPLAQRADPACYTTAYNMVVGMHHNEIMAKEREKILRENGGNTDGSVPSMQRRDSSTQPGVATVAEVLGPDAQREMDNWGWTPDELVQRLYRRTMKVSTWAEAVPLIRAQQEALRSGNA